MMPFEEFDRRYTLVKQLESIRRFKSLALEVLKYFECKRCGACCRQEPCMLSDEEVVALCKFLRVTPEEFDSRFLDHRAIYFYLKTPCPFLQGNECTVYEARPTVCQLYPFRTSFSIGGGFISHCPMGVEIVKEIENEFPTEKIRARIPKEELAGLDASIESIIKTDNESAKTVRPPVEEKPIKLEFVTLGLLEAFLKRLKNRASRSSESKNVAKVRWG